MGKGKLICTIGVQGSGKSTWTREQLDLNPGWVQVEMDMIREELGLTQFDPAKEVLVRQTRDRRIVESLRKGLTVICSDINLVESTRATLAGLAKKCNADLEWKSFLDVPVEECIKRDALRGRSGGRSVGEWVIRRTYAQVRPDDEVRGDRRHLVIGDVHGDHVKLLSLLKRAGIESRSNCWVNRHDLHVVFLGDLNDPRYATEKRNLSMSSWRCIEIARELALSGMATVLRSNHQKNLIELYRGQRQDLSWGLEYTKAEMEALQAQHGAQYVSDRINWLDSLPYFYSFTEGGQLYTCVHAYYTEGMKQYCPEPKAGNNAIYGPREKGWRVQWWQEATQRDRVIIAGHYHKVVFPAVNQAILLDGECGDEGGELLGLLIGENRLLRCRD